MRATRSSCSFGPLNRDDVERCGWRSHGPTTDVPALDAQKEIDDESQLQNPNMRSARNALRRGVGVRLASGDDLGQIGCAEQDIAIVDDNSGWGTRTWTATCQGKTYFCSSHGGGQHSTAQVSCKENGGGAAPAAPAAPAAASGCQYDTQCKGDRVCKAGSCVDPAP